MNTSKTSTLRFNFSADFYFCQKNMKSYSVVILENVKVFKILIGVLRNSLLNILSVFEA